MKTIDRLLLFMRDVEKGARSDVLIVPVQSGCLDGRWRVTWMNRDLFECGYCNEIFETLDAAKNFASGLDVSHYIVNNVPLQGVA